MKMHYLKVFVGIALLMGLALPCLGANYRIEVLQVAKIDAFETAFTSMKKELAKNGLVEGQNLTINRVILDVDMDPGIWQKATLLLKMKSNASRIVAAKPDLVVTIGTPATKYTKDKIIAAGIPVVFTGVAIPELVGCKSKTQAGPGFTGSTLYVDPTGVLQVAKAAFPNLKTVGIVHSDDENAIGFTEETKVKGAKLGINVISKQMSKSSKAAPAFAELADKGVELFIAPIDAYYAIRNYETTSAMSALSRKRKIPIISSVIGGHEGSKGAILYLGPEFSVVGGLAGQQVVKILKNNAKPESLPVLRQENLNVYVDLKVLKESGIQLPTTVLQLAKPL